VYIGWLEATVLAVYLPKEKRTSIHVRSAFLTSLPPCHLGPAQLHPSATTVRLNPRLPLYSRTCMNRRVATEMRTTHTDVSPCCRTVVFRNIRNSSDPLTCSRHQRNPYLSYTFASRTTSIPPINKRCFAQLHIGQILVKPILHYRLRHLAISLIGTIFAVHAWRRDTRMYGISATFRLLLITVRVANTSLVLRTGGVSVVIRGLVHHSWQEPAGKVQLDRDQLFARDRHSTDRVFLCL
jgi:hypothetical protein